MKALDLKLFRDLRRLLAQVVAIALVVASGVALFVATMTTYSSLRLSEAHYYAEQRFADVWSSLARAPLAVARDAAAIPGVAAVDARINTQAILDVPGLVEPASAVVLSIPGERDERERAALERAALACPVHRSLRPEVEIPVRFAWGAKAASAG